MKTLNYIHIVIILFLFLFFALPAHADWLCFDEGKIFTYENEKYPDRITTITVTQRTENYWRIMFEKNHPETYWGSWDEDKNCQLNWWGMSNVNGIYARGGQFFDYDYNYLFGMQYFANHDKDIICDSGHPTYLILPREPFEVPLCIVQRQSCLMYINGGHVWYDYDWIVHLDWEVIWVPYLEYYALALRADFSESQKGKKLINETWWFVKDVGLVQIESSHWAYDEVGRSVKIRLTDIQ